MVEDYINRENVLKRIGLDSKYVYAIREDSILGIILSEPTVDLKKASRETQEEVERLRSALQMIHDFADYEIDKDDTGARAMELLRNYAAFALEGKL